MNRVFFLILLSLTCSICLGQELNPACISSDHSKDWYYKQMCKIVDAQKPGEFVPILFLGDSITYMWSIDKNDKRYPGGSDSWNKYFAPMGAVNFGISGERTEHVLWRVTDGGQLKINPKLIVLLVGTNNLHREKKADSSGQVAEGIKAILDAILHQSPHTKVLLLGILPRGWDPSAKQKVGDINAIISGYADNKQVFYFDPGPALLDKDGKISKEIFRDGLHLSPYGYELFAQALLPEIEKLQQIK